MRRARLSGTIVACAMLFFGALVIFGCGGDGESTTGTCGDGIVDPDEDCDLTASGGQSCVGLGYTGGTLACKADCSYDTTACEGDPCGNGTINPGEDCDGTELGTTTCESLGFTGGALACTEACILDVAGCEGGGTVSGQVTDSSSGADNGVGDALIVAGALSTVADWQGNYEVYLPAGAVTLEVSAPWFEVLEEQVTVEAGSTTTKDLVLEAKALKVLPEDKSLAETYNATFDWTVDTLSITYVESATRNNIDKALYYHNPALFRSTTGEGPLTPDPAPTISGGVAGFDFPLPSGAPNEGQQAFDVGTIVDSLDETPLTAAEKEESLLWEPAIKIYLVEWDIEKSLNLYYVTFAVESQKWGGTTSFPPQFLQYTYLHNNEVWAELVFEDWVTVGEGITDTNGDGKKEVFGRVATGHYNAEIITTLKDDYVTPAFTTLELKHDIQLMLDDLYTRTSPEVVSVIGEPFVVPDHGTLQYPFVVLKHSNDAINVLLVDNL